MATATSIDGNEFTFQSSIEGLDLQPGSYAAIGEHPIERVHAAAEALASEGMVEIGRRSSDTIHARLALA